MIFRSRNTLAKVETPVIKMDDEQVEFVKSFKYLGIMLDDNLTFSEHVTYLKKKTICKLKMLSKLRSLVGRDQCLQLYKSLLLPILDYGDVVYDSLSAKDCRELQRLQNCALRIIEQVDKSIPAVNLHQDMKLPFLSDRRHMHSCNEIYKCIHNLAPKTSCNNILLVSDRHNRETRVAHNLELSLPDLTLDVSRKDFFLSRSLLLELTACGAENET